MNSGSIFNFLEKYPDFKDIYDECLSMEIELKHDCFTGSIRTGRTISELLIKKIAKKEYDYKEKFFYERNGKLIWYDLFNIINICQDLNLIDKKIRDFYDDVRKLGNAFAHGNKNKKYDIEKDAFENHEKIFYLCLDCFKRDHDIDLEYNFNLDYLDNDDSFSHENLLNHIKHINENKFEIDELKEFIHSKDIFLPIDLFKDIIFKYKDYVKNLNRFDDYFKEKKFVSDEDKEFIFETTENLAFNKLNKELIESSKKIMDESISVLNKFNENESSIDDLNSFISINENDDIFRYIKLLASDLIKSKLNEIIDEISGVPVSKIDKNNRYVVEFPKFDIIEDEEGFILKESDNEIILDDDQKAAVEYNGEKPLVINAGPGSGKTRVIIERVVYLIKECNVPPSSILVITFTRKATEELRERFKSDTDLTINDINQMRISTIHSFCRHIITEHEDTPYNYLVRNGERGLFISNYKQDLGFVRESFIYPNYVKHINDAYDDYFNFEVETEKLIDFIKEEYVIDDEYYKFIEDFYSDKTYNIVPSFNIIRSNRFGKDWFYSLYLRVAESYWDFKDLLEENKSCDNNHLLEKANDILEDEYILNNLQYKNILIDEFQDTDYNQMKLFDKLLKISNTFTVVGDADQSIYEWRGASQEYFNEYANNENFELITLHTNYRSTRDIIEFNEELIKDYRSIPKEIKSKEENYKLPVYHLKNYNTDEEVTNIISIIKTLKNDKKIKYYSDIVLLFRNNYGIENMISSLENENIPYYLKDKKDLADQDEIKAILTLYWYILPYNKNRFIPGNEDYLNLYGFTDEKYKSSKIFRLSKETMDVLANIQRNYDKNLLKYGRSHINYSYRMSDKRLYAEIFKSLNDRQLDIVFSKFETYDLADLNESELKELGIVNQHDLDFFTELHELKRKINDKNIKNYEKPSTLDVFYKLLNIIDYYDEINIQRNKVSKKIKSNLALVSEIIYDYENIVGKHYYKGLFDYLNSVLPSYGCPIHDMEDNLNKVHIMTIHKSKGLEYPIVILASLKQHIKSSSNNKKKFFTPISCLKNKPDLEYVESDNRNNEEMRVIYVATTRAEQLLILSSVDENRTPLFLGKISRNFNRLRQLEPYNLNDIPAIKSSNKKKIISNFPELNFEEIIRDYLFCPMSYDITNNFKFRNKNDDSFSQARLYSILNKLFTKENVTDEYMDYLIKKVKNSFKISDNSETSQILNKIPQFWHEHGKNYKLFNKDAININVSLIRNHCDINGKIDLIIKNDDGTLSIVQFIGSNFKIESFIRMFNSYLLYYAFILDELDITEGYEIKDVILHSIKENKKYSIPFDKKKRKILFKRLDKITKDIVFEDYKKYKNNCYICEYKDSICKG